ncbi:MAG: c-type cytochrome [Halobacteriovoraceae bacterium]|jgi:cytochrome c oxidase cbb3-type subunit III|nr:c-type cytochrome [Halobacteriovoraceae bacterium]
MSDNNENEVKIFDDEKKVLLDHNYDGIRELDHPLPKWWLITFAITIIFSIPYYAAYTFFGAQTIDQELAQDMKEMHAKQAAHEAKQGKFNLAEYEAYITGSKVAKIGKKVYKRKCKACHGANGEGGVGPNLTDAFWMHGNGSLETVYNTINKGVVDKGMAAWGPTLGKEKVFAVLKHMMEFKGTNPEGAKASQGQEFN